MSGSDIPEEIRARLNCDTKCTVAAVRSAIEAFTFAVHENFRGQNLAERPRIIYHDRPLINDAVCVMLDELLVPSSNRGTWPRTEIWADFSPLSDEISELQLVRSLEDNHLLVWVSTSQDVTHEREGTRERNRMERECAEQRRKRGRESLSLPDTPQDDELDPAAYDAWYEKYFALERTPSIWPQNRACFLNIVDHLKQALPVRKVELDPRLLDP